MGGKFKCNRMVRIIGVNRRVVLLLVNIVVIVVLSKMISGKSF